MGTPEFAVPALREVARRCDVIAVVTQPDRPRGRGRKLTASAVAMAAQSLEVPIFRPDNVNAPEWCSQLGELRPDLFALVAYGSILSERLLGVPRHGCINLHGSLLPEYRGASPVQRALWDGRSGTGVTTLWMDSGVDTGDCILQRWTAIEADDNAATLGNRLATIGAPLLAESLMLAHRGEAPRHVQPRTGSSYAAKLVKRDGAIDWSLDAETLWNRQRAVTPWPGAHSAWRGGSFLVTKSYPYSRLPSSEAPGTVEFICDEGVGVACGRGVLRMDRIKPESRPEMRAAEWARGAHLRTGEALENEKEAHA